MSADETSGEFKYWAFISYSHADSKWADWLHKGLETYRVPKRLVGKKTRSGVIPKRPFPVFRDRDELPGSANLGDNLTRALRESRYLVVICSPRSAQSQWVDQEVRIFKSLGREDRVLCLIVDGEPNATNHPELGLQECFPEAVRFWVDAERHITNIPTEPIAADLRKGKDGKRHALLKVLAGVLGVNFDDLKQRDHERAQRRMQIILAGVTSLLVIFSFLLFALFQANDRVEAKAKEAKMNADKADIRARQAREAQLVAEKAKAQAEEALNQEKAAKAERDKALADALVAKGAAEQSAQRAKEEEQKAKESEQKAKVSEQKAVDALGAAQVAEQKARAAQLDAEARKKDVERALSMADFNTGTRVAEDQKEGRGLAYLSRALRWNDGNESASARLRSLLDNRNWALPVFPPLAHPAAVNAACFNPDSTLVATVSSNAVYLWDGKTSEAVGSPLVHKGLVSSAAFSPDGKKLLTTSFDKTAHLWDVATRKSIATLDHDEQVSRGCFSTSGQRLATAANRMLRIWDAESGKPVTEPIAMEGPVMDFCFSPDDKAIAVAAANAAALLEASTGKPLLEALKHNGGVICVRFSPNGKLLATGSGDVNAPARIWDVATGQPVGAPIRHKLLGDKCWVNHVEFSPSGKKLATASSDRTACLWDAATGKPIGVPMPHGDEVVDLAFSPNEMFLATASSDRTAAIWDASTGRPYAQSLRHDGPVRTIAFSDEGSRLLTASSDGTARVWNAIRGRPLPAVLHHDLAVDQADISWDGRWIITCGKERSAHLWELGTGLHLAALPHDKPLTLVRFSRDGKLALTGSEDYTACLWEVPSGKALGQPLKHGGWIVAADFSPDGSLLLTACEDRQVRLWDVQTSKPVGEAMKHERALRHACFSADGKFILTASADKTARLWDGHTGKPISSPLLHNGELRYAAISPDGKLVATACDDRRARIFDAATGTITALLPHDGAVNYVSFSADSKLLATASDDKTARVWDATTGKPVTEPFRHEDQVKMAQFSPRGQILLTVSREKMARVWDASSGLMISEPLVHDDLVRWGSFSSDGRYAVTTSDDRTARIWLIAYPVTAPGWLGELAQAVGGYRISDAGGSEPVTNAWNQLTQIRERLKSTNGTPFVEWGRWFLGDRSKRCTSPFSSITVEEFVSRYVESGKPTYLRDALELQPNNGLALAKLARLNLEKEPVEADFQSALAAHYTPRDPVVLWTRAQVLHGQNRFSEAYPIMEAALALDARNLTKFGPDGADFSLTNRETIIKGWLPKGWEDTSIGQAVTVAYLKLNDPPAGETGLQIALSKGHGQALLRGPRFIGHAGDRFLITGWVRSAKRSDLNVTATQFWVPNQKYAEQVVRTTEQWKQFKIPFNAPNDFAAELLLTVTGENTVDVAGVTVTRE